MILSGKFIFFRLKKLILRLMNIGTKKFSAYIVRKSKNEYLISYINKTFKKTKKSGSKIRRIKGLSRVEKKMMVRNIM